MAKLKRQVQGRAVHGPKGSGTEIVHQESYDDSLPDADELSKLKLLDPEIVTWLKARADREQDMRKEFMHRQLGIVETSEKRNFRIDIFTISGALLTILTAMGISALLLSLGHSVTGTIFAGGAVIWGATAFLNFRKKASSRQAVQKSK